MDLLLQDLRYALRTLRRQAGFSITAVLTLAAGIGATSALFSVVHAVVLRPLPFSEPERVAAVMNFWTARGARSVTVSGPDFHDWRAENRSFAEMAYYTGGGETSVVVDGAADFATVFRVTPGFFRALGARAQIGRLFGADEEQPGGSLSALITDAYWKRRFGASPQALGATLRSAERVYTLVGVLAPGMRHPSDADIYVAEQVNSATASRSGHNYRVVARLREGVSLEQAGAEMTSIAQRLEQTYPNSNAGKSAVVVPLQDAVVGSSRTTLVMLFAAVSVVLLIACSNVANLLLARAAARQREMVVRAAVGAERGRLVRQLLTESAVLALIAAAGGVALARLGIAVFLVLAPPDLPRLDEVRVDATVLGFALVAAIASSLVFGVAPALQLSAVQLADGLRQGGKGSAIGARAGWARHAFVVAQVALAVALVAGAAILGKSLMALGAVNLGFDADGLVVVRTTVPVAGLKDAPRATSFYRDLLSEVRAVPGVVAAGAVTGLPSAVRSNGGYWIQGGPGPEDTGVRAPQAIFTVITGDYFRALKVPVLSGRDFHDGDRLDAPLVAIVNDALVRESFPGRDPIGQTIRCGLDTLEPMTIVGVVGDVRTWGPARPAQAEIYMPYEQHPGPATSLNIVARTATEPGPLGTTIARQIRERNADVPARIDTMEGTLSRATAAPRFRTVLLMVFATVALVLAMAGVYSVMAFSVSRRLPEIGVRVALGAAPRHVLALVLREGALLTTIGLVLGLGLGMAGTRLLSGLTFAVSPTDPSVLAGVVTLVAATALVACYVPGRRALRVDPGTALRAE